MKRILFAVVLVLASLPLSAQSTSATLWLSSQQNQGGGRVGDADEDLTVAFDSGNGYGVSVERMFGAHLGGDLSVFRLSSGGDVRQARTRIASLGDVEATPVMAMLRWHFGGERVDVSVGGGLAHTRIGELDSADLRRFGLGPIDVDSQTGFVIGAAAAFNLTPRWSIAVDARYLPVAIEGRVADGERVETDLDPMILSAGVKVRF